MKIVLKFFLLLLFIPASSFADLQPDVIDFESEITVGRVLVRASGTEPKIRIMIEASEKQVAKKFAADIEKLIKSKI